MAQLANRQISELDPYAFLAVLGKRVIHPGGRASTEELFRRAAIEPQHEVLDIGCGVATTAITIARRFGAHATAVDISDLMLERARANARAARLTDSITIQQGDIQSLDFPADRFDRVIAEAVTMFVDRARAARELVRVCKPGGRVLATEFLWRKPPSEEAKHIFLGEICPGLNFDTLDDWVSIYQKAGLTDIEVVSGPFEMMTPKGFLDDEGLKNTVAVMGRAFSRLANLRKMAWLMPRMNRALPYLGYVLVAGMKPT